MVVVRNAVFPLTMFVSLLFSQTFPVSIAVNDLSWTYASDSAISETISETIRAELKKNPPYAVMEKNQMETILQVQHFQIPDKCDSLSCMRDVGNLLGVDRIIYGSACKVKDYHFVVLRMMNVRTGKLLSTQNREIQTISDVPDLIQKLINESGDLAPIIDLNDTGNAPIDSVKMKQMANLALTVEPSNALTYVNGKIIGRDSVLSCAVRPGNISLQIEATGYDGYKTTVSLKPGDKKKLRVKLTPIFGTAYIFSKPPKAQLFINGTDVGYTPFYNARIKPGNYSLLLKIATYEDLKRNITIVKNTTAEEVYSFRHTKPYRDSVAKYFLRKNHSQNVRRIAFGVLAAGLGAAGYYFNWKAEKNIKEYNDIAAQYKKVTTGNVDIIPDLKNRYNAAYKDADENITRRNWFYGFGIGFLAGFCVSIRF